MNILQISVLITGALMMFIVLLKFHRKYVALSRARIQLVSFPSESTRKTRNIYKILLSLLLPRKQQYINPDTAKKEDIRKMLIYRQALFSAFNGLIILILTIGAYLVLSTLNLSDMRLL